MLLPTDIVGAARAPEDPHYIFLSEPLAPIMKFPTRVVAEGEREKWIEKWSWKKITRKLNG